MADDLTPGTVVTVEVPATSANLGPGYDCFGLALDWRERVELTVIAEGFQVVVSGEGAAEVPQDESHLIIRSALIGLADLGIGAPGLRLRCTNTIPHGRGLGSSSAAIVAGLAAAAGLAGAGSAGVGSAGVGSEGARLDRGWLLRHASTIEGHPDNVAAAIYGGFTLAYAGRSGVAAAQGRVDPSIEAVVFVADMPVTTSAARGLLPQTVPHADAAADAGRAALLVHALAAEPALLLDGTRDWLHQGYRSSAMPRSYALVEALRRMGFAAVISGAGPSVAVLGQADRLRRLADEPSPGFRRRAVAIGTAAAVVRRRSEDRTPD